ncbi:MAG: hypothetical protein AAF378_14450 [Cyanobacteria bacterium P01_A01_bin.84]
MNLEHLEPIHFQAIFQLIAGKTTKQISKEINKPIETINEWCKQPLFKNALQDAWAKTYDDAINKLAGVAISAVNELECIIMGSDVSVANKLRAIEITLRHGEKIKDYQLQRRVEVLEQLNEH